MADEDHLPDIEPAPAGPPARGKRTRNRTAWRKRKLFEAMLATPGEWVRVQYPKQATAASWARRIRLTTREDLVAWGLPPEDADLIERIEATSAYSADTPPGTPEELRRWDMYARIVLVSDDPPELS